MGQLVASRVARIPLLAKFNGVYAEDCSTIGLPAELADQYQGCGGSDEHSGKSAMRLFVSYELKTGKLQQLARAQSRGIDAVVARQHAPQLPPGALRLRDMGFFDRQLLARDTAAGIHWIRWQIELLFKRWNSLGGIQVSTTLQPGRVLCEL